MGVIELFGTIVKNGITSSSVNINYQSRERVNHLFIDFNSIIHVCGQKINSELNYFLKLLLKTYYQKGNFKSMIFNDLFKKYKMESIRDHFTLQKTENEIIDSFHDFFDEKMLDKMVVVGVINIVLYILKSYTEPSLIQTLFLAIDGVPSKAKMVEQKQRRYMSSIMENYKKHIFKKYITYLQNLEDNTYLSEKYAVNWNRNKITPGTAFMHKLSLYLRSAMVMKHLKNNRPNLEVIVSDMYEVCEGEKKIVTYINDKLYNSNDEIMVYSPDADVVLLCMLLPVKNVKLLRYNQQVGNYDMIEIVKLKNNIAYYINHHPHISQGTAQEFDITCINHDLVCIATLFGNDFVPKIETLNVKKGFQSIMDAYLQTLLFFKDKGMYLVKEIDGIFCINFIFLKKILHFLLPEEDDFIENNHLYNKYINYGQIRYIFANFDLTSENIVRIISEFRDIYETLKNLIKNNRDYMEYAEDEQFMESLRRSINITDEKGPVNASYLNNKELLQFIKTFYHRTREFPKINVNLKTFSRKSSDYIHKEKLKGKNNYEIEVYKFTNMLDEYHVKFNAQPLDLSKRMIEPYYNKYFKCNVYQKNGKNLSNDAKNVMNDYIEGLLWVFEYYFNDRSYVNRWFYPHERAPLMRHLLMYLDSITNDEFKQITKGIKQYKIENLSMFFNPIEQLIYVSPMTHEVIELLPSNYRDYLKSDNLDPFIRGFFLNTKAIARKLYEENVSTEVDCHSIPYFNKCLVTAFHRATWKDDQEFLSALRKVKPNKFSKRRSKNEEPSW